MQKFRTLGFDGPYPSGRHLYMAKGNQKVHIPNPHGEDISKGLVSEILRQAAISQKDWDKA